MNYALFGENTYNLTDSIYTYSNIMSLDIMSELAKQDECFENINQADVLNLALMLLGDFVTSKKPKSKVKLYDFVDDVEDFKFFALNTIKHARIMNIGYNKVIDECIEEEV